MKIVYVGLYRVVSESEAWRLAATSHLVDFGYFTRSTIAQHIQFAARTCVQRTQSGCRQTIQLDEQTTFVAHTYVRSDGLAAVVIADKEYPVRVAFTLLTKEMAAYEERVGVNWKRMEQDQDNEPDFLKQDILNYQASKQAARHNTHSTRPLRRAEAITAVEASTATRHVAQHERGAQTRRRGRRTSQLTTHELCCAVLHSAVLCSDVTVARIHVRRTR